MRIFSLCSREVVSVENCCWAVVKASDDLILTRKSTHTYNSAKISVGSLHKQSVSEQPVSEENTKFHLHIHTGYQRLCSNFSIPKHVAHPWLGYSWYSQNHYPKVLNGTTSIQTMKPKAYRYLWLLTLSYTVDSIIRCGLHSSIYSACCQFSTHHIWH